MPYRIAPASDGGYFVVTVDGEVTRDLALEHVSEAHALGNDLDFRCLLFDLTNARNVESVIGNFKMTHEDSRKLSARERRACIAVLVDPVDDTHDFNETLARNAGMDVTLFRDEDEAIAHLEARIDQISS